jgi:hypothetical protein
VPLSASLYHIRLRPCPSSLHHHRELCDSHHHLRKGDPLSCAPILLYINSYPSRTPAHHATISFRTSHRATTYRAFHHALHLFPPSQHVACHYYANHQAEHLALRSGLSLLLTFTHYRTFTSYGSASTFLPLSCDACSACMLPLHVCSFLFVLNVSMTRHFSALQKHSDVLVEGARSSSPCSVLHVCLACMLTLCVCLFPCLFRYTRATALLDITEKIVMYLSIVPFTLLSCLGNP